MLELAVTVAHRAGGVAAERFFAADFATRTKQDGTDVTDVDLAVEEMIRTELLRHTPDDEIYGEEGGTVAGTSGRRWIIDPIDGTLYFANRIPLFANLIAYEDEHGPAIGVINNPVAQQMIFAGRGLGCWVRTGQGPDVPAVLRDNTELRQAVAELSNPATWHSELLTTLHQNVWITGYLGCVAGLVTGLLDAVVVAGFPAGYQDLAPLPERPHGRRAMGPAHFADAVSDTAWPRRGRPHQCPACVPSRDRWAAPGRLGRPGLLPCCFAWGE